MVPDGPDLQAAGYDELEFLQDATEDDVEELCEELKMPRPHQRSFLKAWSELSMPQLSLRERQLARRESGGDRGSGGGSGRSRSGGRGTPPPRDEEEQAWQEMWTARPPDGLEIGRSSPTNGGSRSTWGGVESPVTERQSASSIRSTRSAESLYDRTARAFTDQIHEDMLAFRLSHDDGVVTLQDWARQTRWCGPADGPVDSQGVPRIPQQGVFLELWRTVGNVLPFATAHTSPPPSPPRSSPDRPPAAPPRPTSSRGTPKPSPRPRSPVRQTSTWTNVDVDGPTSLQATPHLQAQMRAGSVSASPRGSSILQRPGPVEAASSEEIIAHKEEEMQEFFITWTEDMLSRLGESAEECPVTCGALSESLSMSLGALGTMLPGHALKDLVRNHMLQLAGLS